MAPRNVVFDWEGKLAARSSLVSPVPPLIVDEIAADDQGSRASRLIAGDALDVARALDRDGLRGGVDLIYLDPPYGSGVDYRHEQRVDGFANGRVATALAYRDRWEQGQPAYLDMLYPRLLAMRPLLRATGSIWIQVDWRANYLVRMLCDEVFGRERFLNEIIWRRSPNLGRQARSGQFGRTYDSIIVYGKSAQTRLTPPSRLTRVAVSSAQRDPASGRFFTLAPRGDYTDASVARLESEGRVHRTAKGNVAIRYWLEADETGALCRRQPVDALWVDIAPLRHASPEERTGYPTQKPEALLSRIISAATAPGDVVVDLFAGSGTTGVAAARLGRQCVLGDASAVAMAVARSRLLRAGVPALNVERCGVLAAAAAAQLSARDRGDGTVELELRHGPHDEPVAWAVSCTNGQPSAQGPVAPFRTHWHVERATGRSPEPLPMSVVLPRAPGFAARVYFVSGQRAEAFCTLATGPSSCTMIPLEQTP